MDRAEPRRPRGRCVHGAVLRLPGRGRQPDVPGAYGVVRQGDVPSPALG